MNSRAAELIRMLALQPHPEGGFYRETYRSSIRVDAAGRPTRDALTTIYFLLAAGGFSAWHSVHSDEAWHWYEGDALELLVAAPDFSLVRRFVLGPASQDSAPAATVPADWWQAARPLGSFALCGCTVAPGFEFADFSFLRDSPAACSALRDNAPGLTEFL